jgi:hypothetical protein
MATYSEGNVSNGKNMHSLFQGPVKFSTGSTYILIHKLKQFHTLIY